MGIIKVKIKFNLFDFMQRISRIEICWNIEDYVDELTQDEIIYREYVCNM